MAPMYKESDPRRAGTGQTNSRKMSGRAGEPGHGHSPPQLWRCDTGQNYLQKAAWAGTVLGRVMGSLMAFLLLAWRWSHQFDNVILPQPFGLSSTSLNCSTAPPQRPRDASHLLLPLTSLGFHIPDSRILKSSLYFFCSHTRIQEP